MSRTKLLASVDFLEEAFLCRAGPPSAKALRKWRKDAPETASFSLVAPESIFGGADGEQGVAALLAAVEALDAGAIVFRPPPRLGPSQANRDQFESLIATELADKSVAATMKVLWPRGLWDDQVCTQIAAKLDLAVCFDPLANDPLEEVPELLARAIERGSAYLRPDRIGTPRRRLDPYELETLAALTKEIDDLWISMAHGERARDAVALKKLVAELG